MPENSVCPEEDEHRRAGKHGDINLSADIFRKFMSDQAMLRALRSVLRLRGRLHPLFFFNRQFGFYRGTLSGRLDRFCYRLASRCQFFQVASHFLAALVAFRRILRHGSVNDGIEARGQLTFEDSCRDRFAIDDFEGHGESAVALKWSIASHHGVEDDAQREQVRTAVNRIAVQLFRATCKRGYPRRGQLTYGWLSSIWLHRNLRSWRVYPR